MRAVKDIVKLSFPDKDHVLSNIQAKVKRAKEVTDDKGNSKTVLVEELAPRVERTFNVPETLDELKIAVGGPDNMDRFLNEVWREYSSAHARGKLGELDKETTTPERALAIYLAASSDFNFGTYLSTESKAERAEKAINQNDEIAKLSAELGSGAIDALTFATKVQAILAGTR